MKIGFLLNPIAGMGGATALKGTDGPHALESALQRGAKSLCPQRALTALLRLKTLKDRFEIITPGGVMGEAVLKKTPLFFTTLNNFTTAAPTAADDTRAAVCCLKKENIDLLVFAGGDGTACDICRVLDTPIPVIGIPAGVKMHSSIFGMTPERTGDLISAVIEKKPMEMIDAEIMDMDEQALRRGIISTKLAGYLLSPFLQSFSQGAKSGSLPSEKASQAAIALQIKNNMKKNTLYLIGPGTTLKGLTDLLGFEGTLLGFDLVDNYLPVQKDLTENDILKIVKEKETVLILTPVGGQGYLLGRGNQQISPAVLAHIKKENIIIGATLQKLSSFQGRPLRVDTGCEHTNACLKGHHRVITGQDETMIVKIDC